MVRMVCHRSRKQRLKMKDKFQDTHKAVNKWNLFRCLDSISIIAFVWFKDIAKFCGGAADGEISLGDLLDDMFRSVLEVYISHLHWELTGRFKSIDKHSLVEIFLSIPPQEKEKFLSAYNDSNKFFEWVSKLISILPTSISKFLLRKLSDARCQHILKKKFWILI